MTPILAFLFGVKAGLHPTRRKSANKPQSSHGNVTNGLLPSVVAAFLIIAVTGCEKKSSEAVVLAKEHIDAALPTAEIPNAQTASSPDEQLRTMTDDEIAVDGYVMKPEVRGTSSDPRALKHEQWLVKVRTLDNGRTFQVPADQAKWEKLRENDRVKVSYRTGNYTGTVWAAEIE